MLLPGLGAAAACGGVDVVWVHFRGGRDVRLRAVRTESGRRIQTAGILRPGARALGGPGPGYFFFICSPQQISECGMPGGHGQPFSYTNSAPHFSQT